MKRMNFKKKKARSPSSASRGLHAKNSSIEELNVISEQKEPVMYKSKSVYTGLLRKKAAPPLILKSSSSGSGKTKKSFVLTTDEDADEEEEEGDSEGSPSATTTSATSELDHDGSPVDRPVVKLGMIDDSPHLLDAHIEEAKRRIMARDENKGGEDDDGEEEAMWDPNAPGDFDMDAMPPPMSKSMLQLRRSDSTFDAQEVSLARSMGGLSGESYTYFQAPDPMPPSLDQYKSSSSSVDSSPHPATAHEIARLHINCVHKAFHKEQIVDKNQQIQELKAELADIVNKNHELTAANDALTRQLDKAREDISTISSMSLQSPHSDARRSSVDSQDGLAALSPQKGLSTKFSRMNSVDRTEARKSAHERSGERGQGYPARGSKATNDNNSNSSSPTASSSSQSASTSITRERMSSASQPRPVLNRANQIPKSMTGPLELYAQDGRRSPRMSRPNPVQVSSRNRARTPPLVKRNGDNADPSVGSPTTTKSPLDSAGSLSARASRRRREQATEDAKRKKEQTKDKAIINMLVNWHDQSNKTSEVIRKKQSNEGTIMEECVICCEQNRSVVFLPCAHLCSCLNCSTQCSKCPICRVKVLKSVRVYL